LEWISEPHFGEVRGDACCKAHGGLSILEASGKFDMYYVADVYIYYILQKSGK